MTDSHHESRAEFIEAATRFGWSWRTFPTVSGERLELRPPRRGQGWFEVMFLRRSDSVISFEYASRRKSSSDSPRRFKDREAAVRMLIAMAEQLRGARA